MATKNRKNVKNDKKNLEDPKKSVTFAPGIAQDRQIFAPWNAPVILEKASSVPTENLVPNEALSLRDLFDRTQRGQRLGVNTRMRTDDCPDNMYRMEYEKDPQTGEMRVKADPYEETFDHVPPEGMNDIVDVQRYSEEIAERKKALQEKRQQAIANAKKPAPVPEPEGVKDEPHEPHNAE